MKSKRGGLLNKSEKIAVGIIAIFHLSGFLLLSFAKGRLWEISMDFVPINLIFTTLIVLKFQRDYSADFWKFVILSSLIGFVVEIVGVNTGWIFGYYKYGEVLGPGVLNTPLLIGINWFLISYCIISALEFLALPGWLKYMISVISMTGFDYIMEPGATFLGFWTWKGGLIPLRNYIGWTMVASLIMTLPYLSSFKKKNRVAAITFIIQTIFFALLKQTLT
jgi:putative membrane protein